MKQLSSLLYLFLSAALLSAQTPQGINYQAVARNGMGDPLPNTSVSVKFEIHNISPNGPVVFLEEQDRMTDACGLFNLKIGEANPTDFALINWGSNAKFLEVTINDTVSGTTEILSVPYALYAEKTNLQAGNGIGINGNTISNTGDNDNSANNEIQSLGINGTTISLSPGGGSVQIPVYTPEIYIFEERYPHATIPTTFSTTNGQPISNGFNTRKLNTAVYNTPNANNVTLNSNSGIVTFKPGVYMIQASAPAYVAAWHKLFLRDINNSILLAGTEEFADTDDGVQSRSFINGILVVSGTNKLATFDHFLSTTDVTNDGIELGKNNSAVTPGINWDLIPEVYTTILIQKIAP